MMDINKQWQSLDDAYFSNPKIDNDMILQALTSESKSTVMVLKQRLKYKLNWIIFFIIFFAIIMVFSYKNPYVIAIMSCLMLLYTTGYYLLKKEYNNMGWNIDYEKSALEIMKQNLGSIRSALRKENFFGIIVLPVALISGILLAHLYRGKSIDLALNNAFSLYNMGFMLLLGLLAFVFAYFANKSAYGAYIKQLEKQISDIESL